MENNIIDENLKKYWTEAGIKAYNNRIDNLIVAYNTKEFPIVNAFCLGIGALNISTKEECEGRIMELKDLLHVDLEIYKQVEISSISGSTENAKVEVRKIRRKV